MVRPQYAPDRRLGGSKIWYGFKARRKILCPHQKLNPAIQSIIRYYNETATLAHKITAVE
jgi:hypothetical protein